MNNLEEYIKSGHENDLKAYYLIAKSECIGIQTYDRIRSSFNELGEFFEVNEKTLYAAKVLTESQLKRIIEVKRTTDFESEILYMIKKNIRLISMDSSEYPPSLSNIPNPPIVLFLSGKLPSKNAPLISVIGARECTVYGENIARRLGELIGQRGLSLVSGMARGIDSTSQAACVNAGGYSLAVLGGGVDICYPKESAKLYATLNEQGGILSEYVPKTQPLPKNFALRNRIISGLSDAVCVVEARERSGTLITVEDALNQGKEVYAVPGRITDLTSFGTNELIRQGAGVITDLGRFVDELYKEYLFLNSASQAIPKSEITIPDFTQTEIAVIKAFDDSYFTADLMAQAAGIETYEGLCTCLLLCEKGLIKNIGAGRFSVTDKGMQIRNILLSHSMPDIC